MANNLQVFSFFSGSGFLDLGFEESGFEIVFVNEWHRPFLDAYIYSREILEKAAPRFGYNDQSVEALLDTKNLSPLADAIAALKREKKCLGFIGGPPCPDFSVGGKNKGDKGDNGRLSSVYADLISKFQPDWFLFENVKGLWRTRKHRAFYEALKDRLAPHYQLSERLTNSIEAGVPQDRDRILLFGHHRHAARQGDVTWKTELPFADKNVLALKWPESEEFIEDSVKPIDPSLPIELTVQHWFEKNEVHQHPNALDHFTPRAGLAKFKVINEGDVSRKSYKRLHRWRYSPTAAYGNNEVHLHPYRARRISVAEALAIQSMPREFCLPPKMSLTDKFKTIGNGVPYLLSAATARVIRDFLED